jgi:hypothetical protein
MSGARSNEPVPAAGGHEHSGLQQEIMAEALRRREVLYEAMVALERAAALPQGDAATWWGEVERAVEGVQSGFGAHVVLTEGPGGLFEEIRREAPRLCHQVDVLRGEHERAQEMLEELTSMSSSTTSIDAARTRVLDLLGLLARHRHRGADLVHEAYSADLGGLG